MDEQQEQTSEGTGVPMEGIESPIGSEVELTADAIDKLTDEQAAQIADQMMTLPALEIPLHGAGLRIARNTETGDRTLLVGPVMVQFVLPLSEEGARAVARDLAGGVDIVSAMPQQQPTFGPDGRPKLVIARD